jgi:hypothetical protein
MVAGRFVTRTCTSIAGTLRAFMAPLRVRVEAQHAGGPATTLESGTTGREFISGA